MAEGSRDQGQPGLQMRTQGWGGGKGLRGEREGREDEEEGRGGWGQRKEEYEEGSGKHCFRRHYPGKVERNICKLGLPRWSQGVAMAGIRTPRQLQMLFLAFVAKFWGRRGN